MKIHYRRGRTEDAEAVAEASVQAAEGLADFLFKGLTGEKSVRAFFADILREDHAPYTGKNALVAEIDGKVVGVAFSYSSKYQGLTREMVELFPADRLEVMAELFASSISESLYLDTIYVREEHRGRGVGGSLLELTKKKASRMGLTSVTLHVRESHKAAVGLYAKHGFHAVEHVNVQPHAALPEGRRYLLMRCGVEPRPKLWKRVLSIFGNAEDEKKPA